MLKCLRSVKSVVGRMFFCFETISCSSAISHKKGRRSKFCKVSRLDSRGAYVLQGENLGEFHVAGSPQAKQGRSAGSQVQMYSARMESQDQEEEGGAPLWHDMT